jgi:hypothetical protein
MSGTITPSPAAPFATTAFSDAEKADVRRFCGYPVYGGEGNAGFQGWRFFQAFGLLEFRMNNLAPAEFANVRYWLSLLYPLESAIPAASANLDTERAAVWFHNKNEIADRTRLFDYSRRQLCGMVGVPPGPLLEAGAAGAIVI